MKENDRKILIIASVTIIILQYIEEVLKPLGFKVYMQESLKNINSKEYIEKLNITFIKYFEKEDNCFFKRPFFGKRLRFLCNLLYIRKYKKNNNFDYIHIHYVTKMALIQALFAKSKNTKCYASFWGSDLLRQNESVLHGEEKYLRKFDYISTVAYFSQNRFETFYPKLKDKSKMIPFGDSLLQEIDKYYYDVEDCKKQFKFPLDKKIIAIGYNKIKEQQHLQVIQALKENVREKEKYLILLQLTYGSNIDNTYEDTLISLIDESGFEYKIIYDYLTDEDIAKLRIATDIYINAQTTDAFSNSVKECIYTKTQIINASWLHYPEIDKYQLYLNEFCNFIDIPDLLNKPISENGLEHNRNIIKEKCMWKSCTDQWADIYGIYKE